MLLDIDRVEGAQVLGHNWICYEWEQLNHVFIGFPYINQHLQNTVGRLKPL